MKNKSILFILLAFTKLLCAQKPIQLCKRPSENAKYEVLFAQNVEMKTEVTGNEELRKLMEAQTGGKPIKVKSESKVHVKYGTMTSGVLPFLQTIKYHRTANSMSNIELREDSSLSQTMLFGKVVDGKQFIVDSFSKSLPDTNSQAIVKGFMENIYTTFFFPSKLLKVEDTFHVISTMQVPMGGLGAIPAEMKTIYTLKGIMGDKAYFNIITNVGVNMTKPINDVTLEAQIGGGGTMEYSLKNKMPIKIQIKQRMTSTAGTKEYYVIQTIDTEVVTVLKKLISG